MSFLRRKDQVLADPRPAIEQFWAWWAQNRSEALAAADANDDDRLRDLLAPAIAALHPELDWELTPGRDARYVLIVSGAGHLGLRVLTERWFHAAPDADAEVEYAPVRRANPQVFSSTTVVDDYEVPMGELIAGTRMDQKRGRLDVVVHHPLFPLLGEEARRSVAFRAVYAALGEDDVERWLGAVDVSADPPIDAFAVSALGSVVDQLHRGSSHWAVLTGKSRLGPVSATVRRPFSRVDRPLCDTHVGVVAAYPGGKDGLPVDEAVTGQIQELGERVIEALGGDGPQVVLLGHELMARRAHIHLYVDGLSVDADRARAVLADWPHGKTKLSVRPDPAWQWVQRLLG